MNEMVGQSGGLGSYDEIDVTVQNAKEREHLVDRFPIVGLVQKPVELGRRSA
jgi:hypothetical protein